MACNILIVDSEYGERHRLSRYLSQASSSIDMVVYTAETWNEAAVMLEMMPFDCVLMNYHLPDMKGIALLRMLYDEKADMTPMPVIMMGTKEEEESLVYALRCGAQDYILKDYISADLLIGIIYNNIKAFRIISLAKQVERKIRAQIREIRLTEQMAKVLTSDFEKFKELLPYDVTANDAGDADVVNEKNGSGGIYWVY
jgi:sigma-B regulation protein RsbU (phosphoserine phosphatase)